MLSQVVRVNHDVLMARVACHAEDKRLLRIIRRYLEAGVMRNGVRVRRYQGTPQGGPLSPLLANLLLDDLGKELESPGHRFCRYASGQCTLQRLWAEERGSGAAAPQGEPR